MNPTRTIRSLLAGLLLVVAFPGILLADRFFNDDDLRELAQVLGKQPCAQACSTDRWSIRHIILPISRYPAMAPEESLFLVIEDQKDECGSAGCPWAYVLRDAKQLTLLREDLGVRKSTLIPSIPVVALRARLPNAPLQLTQPAQGTVSGRPNGNTCPVQSAARTMKILNPTCEQLWAYQVFRTESIGFMLAMGKTMEAGIERRLNDQTIASNLIEAASVFSASADLFSDISKSLSAAATVSPRTSAKLTKAVRNSFIAWNLEMPGLLAVVAETGNPAFTDKNAYIFGKEAWNFMVDSIVVGMNPASAPEVLSMKLLQLLNDEWALVNTEDLRVKFDSQLLAQRYLLSYYQHGQNTGLLNRSLGLSANASIKDVLTKLASDQLGFKTGLMQIPIHWPIDISRDVDLAYTLKLVKKLDSALVQPRVKFCMEAPQHCGMQLLTQEQVEDNVESAKRTLSHRQAIYSSIAFSGDSKWIVSTDGFELRVTTTDSLTDIRILQTVRSQDNTGAGGPFLGTRDGLKLFAAGDGLTLWNTSRWRPLYHVRYPIARSGQFDGSTAIGLSLDERTLYSGSIACVVRSIDPNNGRVIREIQVFDSRAFCGHALSAQAGLVASYELERGGVAVKLTTLPTLMLLTGALTPSARVSAAKFSPDGEMLALGLESGIVELWDVRSRKILHSISFGEGSVVGIAFMPNGRQFVAGSLKDKNLKIFDTASGSLLQTLPHRRNPFSWTITISQNGKWLAVSEGNDVVLWSLEKLGWN